MILLKITARFDLTGQQGDTLTRNVIIELSYYLL
jgi:hypothetical protein